MTRILPSDSRLRYVGRIDKTNADSPIFYWAGSMLEFGFTGSKLVLTIENHVHYNLPHLGYLLDGTEYKLMLDDAQNSRKCYEIPINGEGRHSFTLFKRMDNPHWFALHEISLADGADLTEKPAEHKLKLEFFGDSVTVGSVCEAVDHVATCDPPVYDSVWDNAWHSFAMQTARLLRADVHVTAQGGIALLDDAGYFEAGMESTYDKLCYSQEMGRLSTWDFSRYQPDFVVLAVGQNDHHVGSLDNQMPTEERRAKWLRAYTDMISALMRHYPNAIFIVTLTVLMHDPIWEELLDEAACMMNSSRVLRFRFSRTGKATPGHPRIPEHAEMACELTEFIQAQLADDIL